MFRTGQGNLESCTQTIHARGGRTRSGEPARVKKPKLVRDGFTIPQAEYVVPEALKLRPAALKRPAEKGELLRTGIQAPAAMDGAAFLAALDAFSAIKTGRHGKS